MVSDLTTNPAGNKLRAARELGISRCYLHRLLNQLKITEFSEDAVDAHQLAMAEAIDSDLLNSAANA